jgi:ABC-2 type transport system ATP-binding protein
MNDYLNAVETSGLTKKYGDFVAVNSVDFYIPKGEIFGLLGPNGAGKTTTIRMLCGITEPSAGQGNVLGWDIQQDAESIKQNIGYMSQKFSLYNDLTIRENILFYASIYRVERAEQDQRCAELIGQLELEEEKHVQVRYLSGGLRQRVSLACAVVHRPPMLFLDEATAGVDPIARREFWDFIYEMAGSGVSILATTHYMDEAEYCNKVGMMHDGRLIKIASPDSIKEGLNGSLAAIECEPMLQAEQFLREQASVREVSLHGAQLHVLLTSKKEKTSLIKNLKGLGINITQFEFIQPTLEDVFISMIEQQQAMEQPAEKITECENG